MTMEITRPIVGIENRTAQEVFDIMCDRIRLSAAPVAVKVPTRKEVNSAISQKLVEVNETAYGKETRKDWRMLHTNEIVDAVCDLLSALSPAPVSAEPQPVAIEIQWPEYNYSGMGCGLEDRDIHDRYDAMRYGWDCAVEACAEAIPEGPLFTFHPDIDADKGAPHPDDIAVDRFAAAMKAKLAKKRDEGRGGWEDKDDCSQLFLSQLLREHVDKGDPVDVGNLAMMLHQREERIASLLETLQGE